MALEWLSSARGSIAGLGSGASGDAWFAKAGGAAVVFTEAIVFLVIGIVAVLFIRKLMMYNIHVYVFKRYGNGIRLLKRVGRMHKDKTGKYSFEIAKSSPFALRGKKISVVEQEYFMSKGKGDAIFLYQNGPEDYKPIMIQETLSEDNALTLGLSILDIDASNHAILEHKEIIQREQNKSKMLLYLPTIMMVGGMIFVVVLLWITLGRIEQMNAAMTSGYKMMADAISEFGKQVL